MEHAPRRNRRQDQAPPGGEQNFQDVSNDGDPRRLFAWAAAVDYVLPLEAKPVLRDVINGLRGQRGRNTIAALDIGCSYGINAALLKYDLEMDDLHDHWGQRRLAEADAEELRAYDERYFSALEIVRRITMYGTDPAENAIDFAVAAGLLHDAVVDDGAEQLASRLDDMLERVDLVLSVSCFDDGGTRAFDHAVEFVANAGDKPPWIACFVPRHISFEPTIDRLATAGIATETIDGSAFRLRHFADKKEQERVIAALAARGLNANGEQDGYLHAAFYLSRPAAEAEARPLGKFLRSSGENG